MSGQHLRIGRINYSNLFPIFYVLENELDCSFYEFVEDVPYSLNRLLREGSIDISPSSSIEYLRHEKDYILLEGHSVSSFGPIGSILFFSKKPIEALHGLTVLVSSQSETSVALLQIIMKKFYQTDCIIKTSSEPLLKALESYPAYLLIGDDALLADKELKNSRCRTAAGYSMLDKQFYTYDLGDIWHRHTGLPFVFALWIARKNCCAYNKAHLFQQFRQDLSIAKVMALKNLKKIAGAWLPFSTFSEAEIISYWQGISYDLDYAHKKGLELFRKYAEELKLL